MEIMDNKMWYKPLQGSGIIKSGDLKNILRKSEDPLLIECLYLDTADRTLLANNAVLLITDTGGVLKQAAVFTVDACEEDYTTKLPESGIDLSLFPKSVHERLCGILNGAPLQIQFVSAFEQKKRILTLEDVPSCLLIRMLSHFEESGEQRELCALSVQSMDNGMPPTAQQLAVFGSLTPCEPPLIEAMRLCASGCYPSVSEKRIKKTVQTSWARLLGIRLFDLVKAYVALSPMQFDKKSVLRLRVAARKLVALIGIFKEAFGEKANSYKDALDRLIDDTDDIRAIDLLTDEIDTVSSMHRDFDFTPLKKRLADKRKACCAELSGTYENGGYADGIAAFWVQMHKNMHEGLSNEDIIKAADRIREWAVALNMIKKAELHDIDAMHEYRKTIRKLRYALEGLSEVTVKRVAKAIKSCKRMQDEFGMVGDLASHIKTLQKLSAEANNAEMALLCGVCCGIFAESLPDMQNEAVSVWKDCRNDIKTLEDTL